MIYTNAGVSARQKEISAVLVSLLLRPAPPSKKNDSTTICVELNQDT